MALLPFFPIGERNRAVRTQSSMNEGVRIAEELLGSMPRPLEIEVAMNAVPQRRLEAQGRDDTGKAACLAEDVTVGTCP